MGKGLVVCLQNLEPRILQLCLHCDVFAESYLQRTSSILNLGLGVLRCFVHVKHLPHKGQPVVNRYDLLKMPQLQLSSGSTLEMPHAGT